MKRFDYLASLLIVLMLPIAGLAEEEAQTELPPPTFANVPYGDHPQQVLDFWQSAAVKPAPLAVYIHGGGFMQGSKNVDRPERVRNAVSDLLAAGIHVASIEYRFVQHAKLPAAHKDVAKAVQFLRHKGESWKINTDLFGAWGSSSGAQLCGYLAWCDDMADSTSEDPITHESTRLTCVALRGAQSNLDLKSWVGKIPGYATPHRKPGFFTDLTGPARDELIAEVSIINHITHDDPPVYMWYRMKPSDPIPEENSERWSRHHVNFGIAMEEKLRKAGVEVTLYYPGRKSTHSSEVDFLIEHLVNRPAKEPSS